MEIIWTTAQCKGILTPEIHQALFDFLQKKQAAYGFRLKQVGAVRKQATILHIEILNGYDPKDVIKQIKGGSSYALRQQFPDLMNKLPRMWDRGTVTNNGSNGIPGAVKAMTLVEQHLSKRAYKKRLSRKGKMVKQMLEEGMKPPKIKEDLAKEGISISLDTIYRIAQRFRLNPHSNYAHIRDPLEKMQAAEYILNLKGTGRSNQEIAGTFKVSRSTIGRLLRYFKDNLHNFPKYQAKWGKYVE